VTKRRTGTFRLLCQSYKEVGTIPGIFFALSWLLWLVPVSSGVRWAIVAPVFFLFCLLSLTLLNAVWLAQSESRYVSPGVIKGKPPVGGGGCVAVCLLEASVFLRLGSLVTLFVREGDDEVFLGRGRIDHVQENGILQMFLYEVAPGQEEVITRVVENNREVLGKLLVVPGGSAPFVASQGT